MNKLTKKQIRKLEAEKRNLEMRKYFFWAEQKSLTFKSNGIYTWVELPIPMPIPVFFNFFRNIPKEIISDIHFDLQEQYLLQFYNMEIIIDNDKWIIEIKWKL